MGIHFLILILIFNLMPGIQQASMVVDTSDVKTELEYLKNLKKRDIDSTLILSRKNYNTSKKLDYNSGMWQSMLDKGSALYDKGLKDSSLQIVSQVLTESTLARDRQFIIKSFTMLGFIQLESYNFEEAITNLLHAEQLLNEDDPLDLRFEIVICLGVINRKMKDYETSLKYLKNILHNYFDELSPLQRVVAYNNIGTTYLQMKDLSQAENFYQKAYTEVKKIDSPSNLAQITYHLGKLYYLEKKYEKSKLLLYKSLQTFITIGEKTYQERDYRILGAVYMEQGDYHKANEYYTKSLDLAKKMNSPKAILENYKNIYLNYSYLQKNTNQKDALLKELKFFKKWAYLNDSLYQTQTTTKILELEKQYDTARKNNQIRLLEKENQIKEDELKIERVQRNYLFFSVILILMVLGFFIYAYYYYRRITRLLQRQSKHILTQQTHIKQQNEKLQKAVNTRNKLFSIIAHDLRSPLVSISNISKLIGFCIRDSRYDAIGDLAQQMDRKNDQLLDLTDNLLNWTKSQTESLSPLMEEVSLNEIIEECFDIYEMVSSDKEITMKYEKKQSDFLLWTDRNMIKTICRNLINNAIKFTPRGGQIKISSEQKNQFAKICICDSGIGISKERLKVIFEIDMKNVQSGTEGEKSTGLGLSVCREFTEKLGGEIAAESEEHKGSNFIFTIPIFQPPA